MTQYSGSAVFSLRVIELDGGGEALQHLARGVPPQNGPGGKDVAEASWELGEWGGRLAWGWWAVSQLLV